MAPVRLHFFHHFTIVHIFRNLLKQHLCSHAGGTGGNAKNCILQFVTLILAPLGRLQGLGQPYGGRSPRRSQPDKLDQLQNFLTEARATPLCR